MSLRILFLFLRGSLPLGTLSWIEFLIFKAAWIHNMRQVSVVDSQSHFQILNSLKTFFLKKKTISRYAPTSQDPFQRTDYSWNRTFGDGKCCRLHVRIRDDERGQGPVHCQLLEHDGPGLLEQVSSQNELFDLIILFNWFQWNVWRAKIEEHETKGSSKWRNQYGKNKLTKNLECLSAIRTKAMHQTSWQTLQIGLTRRKMKFYFFFFRTPTTTTSTSFCHKWSVRKLKKMVTI